MFLDGDRANSKKFVPVMAIGPMSSMAVPIARVVIMPVSIVPVMVSTVFISSYGKRGSNNRPENAYGQY
jgi:hypothetical protein